MVGLNTEKPPSELRFQVDPGDVPPEKAGMPDASLKNASRPSQAETTALSRPVRYRR
jgi:hypothetical protein